VKRICREFDTLVAQLEHLYNEKKLSLQKLVFLLQPSKVTLYQLERLCLRLSGLTGGHLLDVLHAITLEQGDKKAREMHQHLLTEAYQPFLRMLVQWIYRCVRMDDALTFRFVAYLFRNRGELKDPYREFMVLEDSSVSREALQEDFNGILFSADLLSPNKLRLIMKCSSLLGLKIPTSRDSHPPTTAKSCHKDVVRREVSQCDSRRRRLATQRNFLTTGQ